MSTPKYSVVLPTLNGAETLAVTLPAMLRIDRDDVEWVISDNHSEDATRELVNSFHDSRVRLVWPERRLPIGHHLEFAFTQARGLWQKHMGDDDYLFPSSFGLYDEAMKDSPATAIQGRSVRYYWPGYRHDTLANTLDPATYTGSRTDRPGQEMAAESLNWMLLETSATWVVRNSVIDQVRRRCGFYASPQHVGFFAIRAAIAASERVTLVDLPVYVIGRHEKSAAEVGLNEKRSDGRYSWDWSFEDPDLWRHCPFQYKGYVSICLDAVLSVQSCFPETLGRVRVRWEDWLEAVRWDLQELIAARQLPKSAWDIFDAGLRRLPVSIRLRWWIHNRRFLVRAAQYILRRVGWIPPQVAPVRPARGFGWPERLAGDKVGIKSIVDIPDWAGRAFPGYFHRSRG